MRVGDYFLLHTAPKLINVSLFFVPRPFLSSPFLGPSLPYLPETVLLSKFVFRANIYTQCYGLSLSFKRIFKALSPIVLSNMPCHLRGKAEGVLFNPQALPNTQESILLGFHLLPFPLCHRKCLDFCKVSHIIFTTLPQIS